jgi:peptide/nickel transport system substrate-binding protein
MTRTLRTGLTVAIAMLALLPLSAGAQGKDTLTVALVSHAPTLDPHMHFERVGILVNINMFDSLLHKNAKLEYEPSLALSWKPLNDTTWEFKLRKGVKFHNGDTMTADDVKYSFDRVLEPGKEKKKSPQYGNIRAIKEVKIVSPDTIQLVTDKPFPLLLERLVFFSIVPRKHIEKVGEEAFGSTATVGTGSRPSSTWSSARSPRSRPRSPS